MHQSMHRRAIALPLCLLMALPSCNGLTVELDAHFSIDTFFFDLEGDVKVRYNPDGSRTKEVTVTTSHPVWAWAYDDDNNCIPGTKTRLKKGENHFDDVPFEAVKVYGSTEDLGECPEYPGFSEGGSIVNPISQVQSLEAGSSLIRIDGQAFEWTNARMFGSDASYHQAFFQGLADLKRKADHPPFYENSLNFREVVEVTPRWVGPWLWLDFRVMDEDEEITQMVAHLNGERVINGNTQNPGHVLFDSGPWGFSAEDSVRTLNLLDLAIDGNEALELQVEIEWIQDGVPHRVAYSVSPH